MDMLKKLKEMRFDVTKKIDFINAEKMEKYSAEKEMVTSIERRPIEEWSCVKTLMSSTMMNG